MINKRCYFIKKKCVYIDVTFIKMPFKHLILVVVQANDSSLECFLKHWFAIWRSGLPEGSQDKSEGSQDNI